MLLSVPLKGGRRQDLPLGDLEIDYKHAWQRQHWGALYSAYGRAPFFDHFGPELERLLFAGHKWLLDFNLHSTEWLCTSMRTGLAFYADAQLQPGFADAEDIAETSLPYHQVFEDRLGFIANLSAIDLLMAEGPSAAALLR